MVFKAEEQTENKKGPRRTLRRIAAATLLALLPAALFSAAVFLVIKNRNEGFPASLWGACACFAAQAAVLLRILALRPKHMKGKTAAALSVFSWGYGALVLTAGIVFTALPKMGLLPPLISFGVLLLFYIISTAAVFAASRRREPAREQRLSRPESIRVLEDELRAILARCHSQRSRELISSVCEALVFSDPLSNFDTASCEDAIARYVYQLDSLDLSDLVSVETVCDALHIQIDRRNEICAQIRDAGE